MPRFASDVEKDARTWSSTGCQTWYGLRSSWPPTGVNFVWIHRRSRDVARERAAERRLVVVLRLAGRVEPDEARGKRPPREPLCVVALPRRAVDERRHRRAILFWDTNLDEVPRVVDEVAPVGVGGAPYRQDRLRRRVDGVVGAARPREVGDMRPVGAEVGPYLGEGACAPLRRRRSRPHGTLRRRERPRHPSPPFARPRSARPRRPSLAS